MPWTAKWKGSARAEKIQHLVSCADILVSSYGISSEEENPALHPLFSKE